MSSSIASQDSDDRQSFNFQLDSRKIRYSAKEISVEKRPGKRTASSVFCSRNSKSKPVDKLQLKPQTKSLTSEAEMATTPSTPSSILQLSCDSDHSDSLSCVSDLSDLSMMNESRFDRLRVPVAGVHGPQPNVRVQLMKLNDQLKLVKSENEEYQKQALFVTGHREELFKLKSKNFGLQRENANLLSQLKSAQEMCDTMRDSIEHLQSKRNIEVPIRPLDLACTSDCKSKLRQAHDEIFNLKTSLTQRKLEVKGKEDELSRLRHRCITLETSTSEVSRSLDLATRGRVAAENTLQILQSERESFVKSRDWYRDQMHAAQEARASLQRELVTAQKLELDLARSKVELEEERVKSLKEKEELRAQLEELVVVERERLVGSSSSKADGEKFRKCEEDVNSMSNIVKTLKSELSITNNKLQEKRKIVANLQNEVLFFEQERITLKSELEQLKEDLVASQTKLGESIQAQKSIEQARDDLIKSCDEVNLQKEQLQNELNLTKERLSAEIKEKSFIIQKLEARSEKDKVEMERLKSEADQLRESLQGEILANVRLQEKHKGTTSEFASCLTQCQELEKSLDEERARVSALQSLNDKISVKLIESESEICSMKEKGKKREEEFAKEKEKIEEQIKIERKQLEEKIEKLEAEKSSILELLENEKTNLSDHLEGINEVPNTDAWKMNHAHCNFGSDNSSHSLDYGFSYESEETQSVRISQLESFLEESLNNIDELQNKNAELSSRLEEARNRIDQLQRGGNDDDDDKPHDDFKSLQARKIVRLECSVAVFEAEVSHLSSVIAELEEQVLNLEQENGRLSVECKQSEAFKSQLKQVQEDLKKDTDLRKELLATIEVARSSLTAEVSNLESLLQREKEFHSETKNKLLHLEHEMALQRKKNESTITNISSSSNFGEAIPSDSTEPKFSNLTIQKLEEQIQDLLWKLEEQKSESENEMQIALARLERQELELKEGREHCNALRKEILELTRKTDVLSEEKNSYRLQVQDMNTALKNSLDHIRRLRTRSVLNHSNSASPFPLPTPCTSPLPPPVSPTHSLDESILVHLLNSPPTVSKNLSNLQNCLAALKSEMVILQSKLEPSTSPSCLQNKQSQSLDNSPRHLASKTLK